MRLLRLQKRKSVLRMGVMLADGKKQGYIDTSLDDETLLVYVDVVWAGFSARPELLKSFKESIGFITQLTRLMCYGFLRKDIGLFRKEGEK